MTITKQLMTGEFEKYKLSGAYHWKMLRPSMMGEFAVLSAHYERFLRSSRPWSRRKVLDLGCGDAALSALMANEGADVIGVDSSFEGVRLACDEVNRISMPVLLALARDVQLPFSDRLFDVVVMSEVIEHLPDPSRCLEEVARVTNSKGYLILSTPHRMTENISDEHYQEFYPSVLKTLLEGYFSDVHIDLYNPVWLYELYAPKSRRLICRFPRLLMNCLCYLGRNPFLEDIPSRYHISIQAICRKPLLLD